MSSRRILAAPGDEERLVAAAEAFGLGFLPRLIAGKPQRALHERQHTAKRRRALLHEPYRNGLFSYLHHTHTAHLPEEIENIIEHSAPRCIR